MSILFMEMVRDLQIPDIVYLVKSIEALRDLEGSSDSLSCLGQVNLVKSIKAFRDLEISSDSPSCSSCQIY